MHLRLILLMCLAALEPWCVARASEPVKLDLVCPAPISTCGASTSGAASCPTGYRCTCVPSCPTCADCAAHVCVPDLNTQCHTACDCSPGLTCDGGHCVAGDSSLFCCESDRCPLGQQCQHADGHADRCGQKCQTACDCDAGLGCFDGQCIAGVVPVYCCESDQCPVDSQCQHRDGRPDRCGQACVTSAWHCDSPGSACGQDRMCDCTASCAGCDDCGPGVCLPHGSPTPYACSADGSCSQSGDRCLCVASCPDCDDCVQSVCVRACAPLCDRRQRISSERIDRIVSLTRQCQADSDCVAVDTSSACRATCGAWINRHYSDRVKKLIGYLDQRYCATFQSDGCTATTVQCADQHGACINGVCRGAP